MRPLERLIASLAFSAFMAACGGPEPASPGSTELVGGRHDATAIADAGRGSPDAAPVMPGSPDAGTVTDAPDAAAPDASLPDAAAPDAQGVPDAGPPPPPQWHQETVQGMQGVSEAPPCDPGSTMGGAPTWRTATVACDAASLGLTVIEVPAAGELVLPPDGQAQGYVVHPDPSDPAVLSVYGATGCTADTVTMATAAAWVCK